MKNKLSNINLYDFAKNYLRIKWRGSVRPLINREFKEMQQMMNKDYELRVVRLRKGDKFMWIKKIVKRFPYGKVPDLVFGKAIPKSPLLKQRLIFAIINEDFIVGDPISKNENLNDVINKKGDVLIINLDENDKPIPTKFNMSGISREIFNNSFNILSK